MHNVRSSLGLGRLLQSLNECPSDIVDEAVRPFGLCLGIQVSIGVPGCPHILLVAPALRGGYNPALPFGSPNSVKRTALLRETG